MFITNATFAQHTLTVNGKEFQIVRYDVTPDGAVLVSVLAEKGGKLHPLCIRLNPGEPAYGDALSFVRPQSIEEAKPAEEVQPVEEIRSAEEVQPVEEARSTDETQPVEAHKQARNQVPEKEFAGTSITGNGWVIKFDEVTQRTRVILRADSATGKPNAKAVKAAEDAGFYWSSAMQSWNKKLTFRAHRAALALAQQLAVICR